MGRLAWYARRLRTMTPAEIAWRAASTGRTITAGVRSPRSDAGLLGTTSPDWAAALAAFRAGTDRPVLLDRDRAAQIASAHPEATAAVVAVADRMVEGRVQYFGYPEAVLARPVDWHHDPVSGIRWPAVAAARLDHRSASGDVKWIWELNRLQHLPWLAEAWLYTGERRYAETAFAHLDTWLEQNPPGTGIAWRGAFEAGVRLISVSVALQGLRDSELLTVDALPRGRPDGGRVDAALLDRSVAVQLGEQPPGGRTERSGGWCAVASRAGRVRRRRCSGRWTGSRGSRTGRSCPTAPALSRRSPTSSSPGTCFWWCTLWLRLAGRPVPSAITAGLRRSATYLAALAGDGDPVPRYGDDDEGFALRLDVEPVPGLRRHLEAVAAVTGASVATRHGVEGLTALWLGGTNPARPTGHVPPSSRYFADGGLVLLRSAGRRLTMDVGPLGYLAIAAHGHADALAVTLAVDGTELIGDPGAGSYYGHPGWRPVHRGTRAHATVTVDGVDQSVIGGAFLWTTKAVTTVRRVDLASGVVDAEHDGYQRLEQPVRHRRWLIGTPGQWTVLVVDELTGQGLHTVRTTWPLHPDLESDQNPAGTDMHAVSKDGQPVLHVAHAATAPLTLDQVRGDEETGLGWWSERLESRRPAWWLSAVVRAELPLVIVTALHPASNTEPPSELGVARDEDRIVVTWGDADGRQTVQVHTAEGAMVRRMSEEASPARRTP